MVLYRLPASVLDIFPMEEKLYWLEQLHLAVAELIVEIKEKQDAGKRFSCNLFSDSMRKLLICSTEAGKAKIKLEREKATQH